VVDRHPELGAEAPESEATVLDRDQRELALAPKLAGEDLGFRCRQSGLRPLQRLFADSMQPEWCGFTATRNRARRQGAPRPRANRELVQGKCAARRVAP